ncbi:MAG: hypothetical protein SGI73_19975 [Chloroflexota bacterium]|nr:hypothetical protein [Chloroflexota bacterium]
MVKGTSTTAINTESDSDARLLRFLHQTLNTFVKWDIARFFHDNPYAADAAESIARGIGREGEEIAGSLQELAASGVLRVKGGGANSVYSLVDDAEMRRLVDDFVVACDNRDFRLIAIQQVIEGLR